MNLSNGVPIPAVGLGTWQGSPESQPGIVGEAVNTALGVGFRHIDCASFYGNQKEIGSAISQNISRGMVKREDLWITSKLWSSQHDNVREAFEQTMDDLQLDYLDLFLIHWPIRLRKEAAGINIRDLQPKDFARLQLQQTWTEMEKLLGTGRLRAIGVSNFSIKKIDDLLSYAKIVPSVNQVECHPVWQQKELHEYCLSKNIHLSGYSPLGKRGLYVLENELVKEIANKLGKTPAQIALRWGIQSGHSVLPKSTTAARLKENLSLFDWSIPEEDFRKFANIEQKRLNEGEGWVNNTTSPYKSLDDLWN